MAPWIRYASIAAASLMGAAMVLGDAATQQAKPNDPTMDWLFNQATTTRSAAATEPATAPSVFTQTANGESKSGTITLSNGEKFSGVLSTTPEQPFRVFDVDKQDYLDVPLTTVQSMKAVVLWEQQEKEWKFRASGSDQKEYSGKTYPARETQYTITLDDGTTIHGSLVAPVYVQTAGGQRMFILHKRDKGAVGQSLDDLVYVREIVFEK